MQIFCAVCIKFRRWGNSFLFVYIERAQIIFPVSYKIIEMNSSKLAAGF